jgi:hypothetical protein
MAPFPKDGGGQLRAVVGAQIGRGAALGGKALEDRDGLLGVDRAADLDRQRLAGELVDDVEELQLAAVLGGVVLEVERPDVVGRSAFSLSEAAVDSPRRRRFLALAGTRSPSSRQIRCTRLRSAPSLLSAGGRGRGGSPNGGNRWRAFAGEPAGLGRPARPAGSALGRSVLAGKPARPTLGDAEAVLQHADRPAPPGRAQKFPGMKMGTEAPSPSGAGPTVASPGDGAPRRRTTRSGRPC